jgi:hypothetical protein
MNITLTEQELQMLVSLAAQDLIKAQNELKVDDPLHREILSASWELYMSLLKQSDMPGARSDNNPYGANHGKQ